MSSKRKIKARDVAGYLKEEIFQENLAPGTSIVSARELAEKHGVPQITANRAINLLVDEGILYRVKGSGTFVKKLRSAGENCENKLHIGMASYLPEGDPAVTSAAYMPFQTSAAMWLRKNDCEITNISFADLQDSDIAPQLLNKLDGLIISVSLLDDISIPLLENLGKPVVVVQHEKILNLPFHQVVPDLTDGYKSAISLLEQQQINNIALVCYECHTHNYRLDSFMEILKQSPVMKNVTVEIIKGIREVGDHGRFAGRELGEKIVKAKKFDAVFSASDFLSFGLVDVFTAHGLIIGQDIHLLSYDNLEDEGFQPYDRKVLSSVCNPRKVISEEAAKLVCRCITSDVKYTQIVRIPTTFKHRKPFNGKS